MAAILNSSIFDSAILHKTLTQTNSIWFKLIHSDSTWWWQPSWILPSWIRPSWIKTTLVFPLKLNHTCQDWFLPFAQKKIHSHFPPHLLHKKPSLIHFDSTWWWQPSWILPCWIKKTSLIHSDSTGLWQPSWILPCWIQTPCYLLSDSLKNTLIPLWLLTQTNSI